MDDVHIIELYWDRCEDAITQTAAKYGRYCHTIAYNILFSAEDASEVVNDTYMDAWNSMPPHRPAILSAYLGKIARRISLDRWRVQRAKKRGGGQAEMALEELSDSVVAVKDMVDEKIAEEELTASINLFLSGLSVTERDMFVCRYWFLMPVREIGESFGFSESRTKSMLFRIRKRLKSHLQKEGFV